MWQWRDGGGRADRCWTGRPFWVPIEDVGCGGVAMLPAARARGPRDTAWAVLAWLMGSGSE